MLKPLLFLISAAILFYQIFTVGLANNGDFPRIAGRLSLCPAAGWDRDRFTNFVPAYVATPACYWDSRIPTSAMLLARMARVIDGGPVFHIRTLGALYALLLLAIFGWLLQTSPLYALAAFVFLDVGYIAYCNSFFLEASSLVGLLAVLAASLRRNALVFVLAALFLITSKTQHAWLAAPLSAYGVYAFRPRAIMLAATAAFLSAAVWMTVALPVDYKALGLWDSVFVDLLPYDRAALPTLNTSPEYAAYTGRNAYQFPDQPTADRLTRAFYEESGFRSLLRYYATHPIAAAQRMWRSASRLYQIRPLYLAQYERGSPPRITFSFWTDFKSAVYFHLPWLAVLAHAGSIALLWRSPHRPILLLLLAMAPIEFLTACFADNIDDYRHLFLFQTLGDLCLSFAAGHIINAICARFWPSRFVA